MSSFPVVPLETVPPHGLTVKVESWANEQAAHGLGGTLESVGGTLYVKRVGGDLHVTGTVDGTAHVPCDRCSADVRMRVRADVDCLYAAPRGADQALPEDDYADIGDYDGVALDLAHVVGECLALERPARVLCGDDDPAADESCLARWRTIAGDTALRGDPRFDILSNDKPTN